LAETAIAAMLDTDLLTPLGAYLRLRELGRASFLLESVEQGRLGRHSFVGSGSRLLDYEAAERSAEPMVGYLAYDFVAKLEPTVPLPRDGRGLPESRFVAADVLVRFDHVRGVAEILHGDADDVARALAEDIPRPAREQLAGASTRRFPSPVATTTRPEPR
jgi:anthranilate/para-aminobenzoate synthase component I